MISFKKFILILAACFALSSCVHRYERYDFGDYSQSERFYNKGQYKKAIDKYKAYLGKEPEGNLAVISQYYMGKSYAALKQTDEAKKIYQQIVEKYPDLVWANFAQNQLKELELHQKKI